MTPPDICRILESGRFDLSDEKRCQAEIHTWLEDRRPPGVSLERERRLGPRDIPDFVMSGVVIEIKMNAAQPRAVIRQLARYAEYPEVEAVILASSRTVALPPSLAGKPVFNVSLGKAWL